MAADENLTNEDTADTRLHRGSVTSPKANQGCFIRLMGSLLGKHKVAGACATAFGKSLTDLLLLLHVYK